MPEGKGKVKGPNQGATPGGNTFPTRNSWYPLDPGEIKGWVNPDHEVRSPTPTGIEPPTPRSRVQRVTTYATRPYDGTKRLALYKRQTLLAPKLELVTHTKVTIYIIIFLKRYLFSRENL